MNNFWFWFARPLGEFLGVIGLIAVMAAVFGAFLLILWLKWILTRMFFGRGK